MADILDEGTVACWNLTKFCVQFFYPIMRAGDKESIERTSQYM
jgi:hypothetical protein